MKKIILIVIVVVVIILLCTYIPKKNEPTGNEVQNTATENVVTNNVEVKNIVETNKTVDNQASNKVENLPISTNDAYKEGSDVGTTEKKQEAIDLVKKTWGEDKTVSFRCDSITSTGEYIIVVVSNETATVKNYFRVNLENKTVEVDY